jgi:molybdopterin-dependent oxidoreductase alpha subunit
MDEDRGLRVGAPAEVAAGPRSVVKSLRAALGRMGPVRSVRTLARVNQKDGFDCPACAWPESDHRHRAEFCENGVKAVAEEAMKARLTPAFFERYDIGQLSEQSDYWLGQQGRLTEPMVKRSGSNRYEPISWDDAYGLIAAELGRLDSPDQAIFYTSGRTSNEAAFCYQLFVRALGTNNLPDCSNLCHESSGVALTETLGVGKGSVSLEDVHSADLIFVVGQNPGTNHPRMLRALETAKRSGARIVSVNPLPEPGLMRFKNPQTVRGLVGKGTPLADLFLQVRVNGDLALFKALNRLIIDAGAVDQSFVDAHCDGYKELRRDLEALSWADVEYATGLERARIEEAAKLAAESERTVVCWAMGLTQHRNAVATIREIVNFLLLRGNIGRPGAGLCPVRGHSNVQGDRTMGICERPTAAFLDRLGQAFGFEPPRAAGFDVVNSIRAMREGRAQVFMALGGNFLRAAPDTDATAEALRRMRLTVQVSTKLNRSHLVTGEQALILPALARSEADVQASGEQVVSVENSMSMVHQSRGRLEPASPELRSEVAIVCGLARRTLDGKHAIPWTEFEADYSRVRARIAEVVPGFERYEERLADGFVLPHPPRDERRFPTSVGRARLSVNELDPIQLAEGRLLLQTMRSHDQYNTTIYGLNDRYRGVKGGRRVVLVHPDDLEERGLRDGDHVDLVGEWEDGERRAERFRATSYPTARGCAAAYFPETNALVPLDSTAEGSNTPTSKSIVIRLEPSAA